RCTIRAFAAGSPTTVISTRRNCVPLSSGSTPMSSGGHAASSSGCAIRPRVQETGSTGSAERIPTSSPTRLYAMAAAEHREPYESRGSRTVLGAPGGESPLGDSTKWTIPSEYDGAQLYE